MKWIGQNIYDYVSRFRNNVHIVGSIYSGAAGVADEEIISNDAGDITLKNIDALDSTTEGAIEASIDTLVNLVTIGSAGTTTNIAAGDLTMYNAVNDGNPTISLGSSATERLEIKAQYESGAQGLDVVKFTTYTAGSSANDARFSFFVDEVNVFQLKDTGVNLPASMNLSIGGTDILADSSGTTTLSNIDALDATTEATIESAIDTLGSLTSAEGLATVGTITTGEWRGTVIASAYLDADTAHISATKEITHHNYKADQDTTETYVGLADADSEGTSTTNNDLPFTAPVAGKLLKVFLRSDKNINGHTLTWRLRTISAGSNMSATPTEIGVQSGAGCQNSTMTTYDFTTGLDSGTNAIAAADAVFLTLQSNTDFGSNVQYYITCLWEWNLS